MSAAWLAVGVTLAAALGSEVAQAAMAAWAASPRT